MNAETVIFSARKTAARICSNLDFSAAEKRFRNSAIVTVFTLNTWKLMIRHLQYFPVLTARNIELKLKEILSNILVRILR